MGGLNLGEVEKKINPNDPGPNFPLNPKTFLPLEREKKRVERSIRRGTTKYRSLTKDLNRT